MPRRLLRSWLVVLVCFVARAPAFADGDAGHGKALYSQICSHCHGPNMVNPGNVSFDLRKFPADEKSRFVESVTNGKNNMPALGGILSPKEIDDLFAYVLTRGE